SPDSTICQDSRRLIVSYTRTVFVTFYSRATTATCTLSLHDALPIFRPGVVWFGEPLPQDHWQKAEENIRSADAVVIVGTSGSVWPGRGFRPLHTARARRSLRYPRSAVSLRTLPRCGWKTQQHKRCQRSWIYKPVPLGLSLTNYRFTQVGSK